jgi:hypothetical protein
MELGDLAAQLQDDSEAGKENDALVQKTIASFERTCAAIAAL